MYRFYLYHPDLKTPQRIADPVGWDIGGKVTKRDMATHGVFFEYSPKLKFVKDGRAFINYYYNRYGVEAEITLTRYRKNKATRKYDLEYTGRLNLMTRSLTDIYLECNIEQTGFSQKFKNRQDIKVDLQSALSQEGKPLTDITPKTVVLPSKVILKRFTRDKQNYFTPDDWIDVEVYAINAIVKYNATNWVSLANGNVGNTPSVGAFWDVLPDEELGHEVVSFFIEDGETWYILPSFNPHTLSLDEIGKRYPYALQASQNDPVTDLKYNWVVEYAGIHRFKFETWTRTTTSGIGSGSYELILTYGKQDNYTSVVIGASADLSNDLHHFGDGTIIPIYLSAGDQVYIYYKLHANTAAPSTQIVFVEDYRDLDAMIPTNLTSFISIEGDTVYPDTRVPLVLLGDAFMRTVESITDKKGTFRSAYYSRTDSTPVYDEDGEGSLRGLLTGKLVRGFPIASNHVPSSFKDLMSIGAGVDGVGVGIEREGNKEYIVVEKLGYFYSAVRSAQLPFVSNLESITLEEFYHNELDGGVDKWNNEQIGNLDEPNATRTYTLPITQVKRKLPMRPDCITSSYSFEAVRRDNFVLSSSKDNNLDNDLFLLQLRRSDDGFSVDRDEDFTFITGVYSPKTLYNAKLSPMRCVKRNGSRIRLGLWKRDDKEIKLSAGAAGNTNMISRLATESENVSEQSIAVNKLDKPYAIAEGYKFDYPLTAAQIESIESNYYGYIEFAVDGKTWGKGYLLSMEPKPDSNLTTFKLLQANL